MHLPHISAVVSQIAQRHFNAHAFVNMAIFLDVRETGCDGQKGLKVEEAHVSIGFDQLKGTQQFDHCMRYDILSWCTAILPLSAARHI